MKLAILSAGAPRHGLNLCTMVQSISDSEGWGWQTQFVPWVKDGYDSFDFSTVDWCWWEGCFERVFEFMGQIEGPHHAARWIGTDLLHPPAFVSPRTLKSHSNPKMGQHPLLRTNRTRGFLSMVLDS